MSERTPWKTEKWWVSHFNYLDEIRREFTPPEKVIVHDITLRDGEQQPALVFRKEEKLRIARKLDETGIHRIEAGMPTVSAEDKEAVKAIAHDGLSAKVFSFARCMKKDVDEALACDVDGVVMEVPASEHIIPNAYGWPIEKAIELSVESTTYAGEHGLYVTFFTIDQTRADLAWCLKLLERVATEGHMDSLAVVDTFGVCGPQAIAYLVKKIKESIKKPVEIHCHNDFGLGTANTISAVLAGAEVIHTTVNAIGERSGNAAIEEVALALLTMYGIDLGIKYDKLLELSELVQQLSGVAMPPNKPVVGANAFKIESGIIAAWWARVSDLGIPLEILPFRWDLIGQRKPQLLLGKKSGKDSVTFKARELGLSIPDELVDKILLEIKTAAIAKKAPLADEEFRTIVDRIKTTKE
ncbi:pyruvate carboxyltransferase [Candidatus Bathyarchaeota archaeon]|nr:pyruvate carboxyltransferase [Candidatus Bathyarchaeota archaeon]